MSETALYEPAMLAELRTVMEEDFTLLVETFLTDTQTRIRSISEALQQGDADAFRRACHSLKGSASNLGLTELEHFARRGEEMGHSGSLDGAKERLDEISAAFSRIEPVLKAEITGS